MKNYYRRLGVSLVASPDDIKRAYHREAQRTHPDTQLRMIERHCVPNKIP